jgi:hypothetical protein
MNSIWPQMNADNADERRGVVVNAQRTRRRLGDCLSLAGRHGLWIGITHTTSALSAFICGPLLVFVGVALWLIPDR